jgi:hypothetical protein
MDGREPVAFSYVNSGCSIPEKEDDFDHWYQNTHFVDVVKGDYLTNPVMFHNTRPTDTEGKLIALYEIYWDDIEAGSAHFTKNFTPHLRADFDAQPGFRRDYRNTYRVLRRLFGPEGGKVSRSLLAVRVDASDPARLDEFKAWYADVRLPDVVGAGLYHTGSFAESVGAAEGIAGEPGRARFVGLYESEDPDAEGLARRLEEFIAVKPAPDFVRVEATRTARRASPV